MTFIWPWMLVSLFIVPVFVWGYLRLYKKRKQASAALGPLSQVQSGSGSGPGRRLHTPPVLYMVGLTLLLFGLARPEMVVELPRVEGTVILALDVSNSMAADDLEPTRMEAAKEAAKAFVENRPSTIQVGIVAFSNGGLVIEPPTYEQAELLATIERLTPQGATSLGQGIFSSLNAIVGEPIPVDPEAMDEEVPSLEIGYYPSAVVLLLTDGEQTSSPDPLLIAQLAAEAGVRIYTVGIGSPEGAILKTEGFSVLTQLNEAMLQEIADLTNGSYYYAEDEEALQEIYNNVDLQLTISGEKTEVTAIFAGLSLVFFLIGGALSLLWFGRMPL
jgi:Ca-activated chloride channel family protein